MAGNPFTSQQAPMAMQMIAPDIAAQQVQLTRQQQIAQALMQQGMTPGGQTQMAGGYAIKNSPLEGINKLAQVLMGGYQQKQADQKQLDLSKALQGRMADILGGGNGAPPQLAAVPQATPADVPAVDPSMPAAMTPSPATPMPVPAQGDTGIPASAIPGNPAPMPAQVPQAPQPPVQQPQGTMTGNNFNMANLIRGQAIAALGGDPAASAYWDTMKLTDASRMAQQAGLTPQESQNANRLGLDKANFIPPVQARAGSTMLSPTTGLPVFNAPHVPDGFTPTFGPDGKTTSLQPIPGALGAIQASTQATAAGKAAVEPIAGVDSNGKPVFTNKLDASGSGGAQGGPTAGGAPVNAGRFGGYQTPSGGGAVTPSLPAGAATAAEAQAGQNAKRAGILTDTAADSPTRVNVLDNILALSKSGVETGPTADFTNKMKGYAATIPGLGAWKDDVTGYQELTKYLNQNGLRAWQAAGGSGTDAQLSSIMKANPNDKMFPQAVQAMVTWAKAGELAVQSKAAAQDQWLAAHNNNPQAQNQFETQWRANFDPRIFQMKLMDPTQLQTFVTKLPDADRTTLLKKYSTAKQNGWLQ